MTTLTDDWPELDAMFRESKKPILCLDFDGVVHSYMSGWKGANVIPDPPVEGAIDFIAEALVAKWDVCIYSSRSHQWGGIKAMQRWLKEHAGNLWYDSPAGPGLEAVRFPKHKPSAKVTLDDRALTFEGWWPDLDILAAFQPWNKRDRPMKFDCAARKQPNGPNDPAECDWPFCGCDPYADRVLSALSEMDMLKTPAAK